MSTGLPDSMLIRLLQDQGKEQRQWAWDLCHRQFSCQLEAYVRKVTENTLSEDRTKEIVQDAILRGVVNISGGKYQPRGVPLIGYFMGIARNVVREEWKILKRICDFPEDDNHVYHSELNVPNDSNSDRDELLDLYRSIASLPPRYREIIELRYFQEREIEEIAQQLNLTKGNIYTRLSRAISLLFIAQK